MTFQLNEMYGYSRLCDRLRSSATIWKQVSLRSSAIYDPRSCSIRDRLRSYGNQPLVSINGSYDKETFSLWLTECNSLQADIGKLHITALNLLVPVVN